MSVKWVFTCIAFCCIRVASGQYKLEGKVMLNDTLNAELVTVMLQHDNPLKQLTTATNKAGYYTFEDIQPGKYTLRFSFVSFDTKVITFSLSHDTVIDVTLSLSGEQLKEISVAGKKTLLQRKIDRIVFNIENSITASTGNVWEGLKMTPGILISNNKGVVAFGKSARVMIDGRMLPYSEEEMENYLQSIPASNIKSIEVITNPPSKYDAGGAALINIILKKPVYWGHNAIYNIGYTQSQYPKGQLGATLNYRAKRFDYQVSYNARSGKYLKHGEDYVVYSKDIKYSRWDLNSDRISNRQSHIYRANANYNVSKNHVIGVMVDGSLSSNSSMTKGVSLVTDREARLDSTIKNINDTRTSQYQFAGNINYKGKLDSLGKELNIDVDYIRFNATPSQLVNSETTNMADQTKNYISFKSKGDQHIQIMTAKIDYAQPLKRGITLEAGAKMSLIRNDNEVTFLNIDNGINHYDSLRSNRFNYKENIQAMYAEVSKGISKFYIKAGLRLELTQTTGNSITLKQVIKNDYARLFPTLFIEYTLHKKGQLNFSLSSRISRPEYYRLNPFRSYITPYYSLSGNAFLQPSFTQSYELSYTYDHRYFFTLYHNRTSNQFVNISKQDNNGDAYEDTQVNLGTNSNFGFSASTQWRVNSFWEINSFIQLFSRNQRSSYDGDEIDLHDVIGYGSVTNSFVLSAKRKITAEVACWYSSPNYQGIYKFRSTSDVSIGFRKTWKKGTSLGVSINDIFYKNPYKSDVNFGGQLNGFIEYNDTRLIKISFTGTIGNKQLKEQRRRRAGSEDEKRRM